MGYPESFTTFQPRIRHIFWENLKTFWYKKRQRKRQTQKFIMFGQLKDSMDFFYEQ